MLDERLVSLYRAHEGPFPKGYAGVEIHGVDLSSLDDLIFGVASHYTNNHRSVSPDHVVALSTALLDLEKVMPDLATDAARDYFQQSMDVASYLLANRRSGSR
jgi:hypothetical protein